MYTTCQPRKTALFFSFRIDRCSQLSSNTMIICYKREEMTLLPVLDWPLTGQSTKSWLFFVLKTCLVTCCMSHPSLPLFHISEPYIFLFIHILYLPNKVSNTWNRLPHIQMNFEMCIFTHKSLDLALCFSVAFIFCSTCSNTGCQGGLKAFFSWSSVAHHFSCRFTEAGGPRGQPLDKWTNSLCEPRRKGDRKSERIFVATTVSRDPAICFFLTDAHLRKLQAVQHTWRQRLERPT